MKELEECEDRLPKVLQDNTGKSIEIEFSPDFNMYQLTARHREKRLELIRFVSVRAITTSHVGFLARTVRKMFERIDATRSISG